MKNQYKFSVCIPIYYKESPANLRACLDSMVRQSALPNEILLLTDDPSAEELDSVIAEYVASYSNLFRVIPTPRGAGIGAISRRGVEECKYEYIARMDSDDIALPTRFEKELNFLQENPNVSIVGSNIAEFDETPDHITAFKNVPASDRECKKYLKYRNPFNHMTVMFKKQSVVEAGNYSEDSRMYEDYYLWISMAKNNCIFGNIEEPLVFARTGTAMYQRRGGIKAYRYDRLISQYKRDAGIINVFEYLFNCISRFLILVVFSDRLREWTYKHLLRKQAST